MSEQSLHGYAPSAGDAESLPQRNWRIQTLLREIVRRLGLTIADVSSNNGLKTAFAVLALFMVAYPIFQFVQALQNDILLISFPQLLMLIAGLFGLRLSNHWSGLS